MKAYVDAIALKSPLQKKRLNDFLAGCDATYWRRADEFSDRFTAYLDSAGLRRDYAVDAYLKMCGDMVKEQTKFLRTGRYSAEHQQAAYDAVYSNQSEMRSYMIGLALSQFLWRSHYEIFDYFLETIARVQSTCRSYLEIGAGHGLFLAAALDQCRADRYQVVDISPISLEICRGILPFLAPGRGLPSMRQMNAMDIDLTETFDFVTMGEVIEHLDDPRPLLRRVGEMLSPGGKAFLTTCANCPTIDHVYLFHNVQEIRDLFTECGLEIESERVLPSEEVPEKDIERLKITVNYAAVVRASRTRNERESC